MHNFIIATVKSWNVRNFSKLKREMSGNWFLIDSKEDLTYERIAEINPKYIFFPHWSWIVPSSIVENFECVCFHMADVPYGRGGSPLQNLIIRGHHSTKLTALKMERLLDAGPVYMKSDLSLEGSAQEILKRCSELTFEMIKNIVSFEPIPQEQVGEVVEFKRRTPAESRLSENLELEKIYDFIRMLDAEGYPKAFLEYGDYTLELDSAELKLEDDAVAARVIIKPRTK
ncbi:MULTISPECIES: methionyl-tRNA formyltransferase [Pseudoalteromonas]|uniref:methionyl-tRNA formyltransferase n=1 Tax=Pseudoalteromonas TaxID=53246 RepID=UPI0015819F51|nr:MULTISPECIES: methionyl-tRNA formyltransferase [Pseudoalteromonas]MDI4652861.1 methionyl-tRNA formyltransferase [Pseudoalteromonas shioyasakiensis]NUJ39649.1 methionyl-tRNA formyltransferase [Pseudoalteromonas sp. 0303]